MTFGELITKQLFGEIEVYINTDSSSLSDSRVKLFDSFGFDPEKEETVKDYKENIHLFWDYDVVWFAPRVYEEVGFKRYYIKILIKKPQKDEELPF